MQVILSWAATAMRGEMGRQVCLLSTRAGGAGLNLIGGCHLVLLDSDWNPALDLQAKEATTSFAHHVLMLALQTHAAMMAMPSGPLSVSQPNSWLHWSYEVCPW